MAEYYCVNCGNDVGSQYQFCSSCGSSMFVHIKEIICEICGNKFLNEFTHEHHLILHPKCKICGRLSIDLNEYEKHVSTHPKCELCGMRFSDLSDFNAHMLKGQEIHKKRFKGKVLLWRYAKSPSNLMKESNFEKKSIVSKHRKRYKSKGLPWGKRAIKYAKPPAYLVEESKTEKNKSNTLLLKKEKKST